MSSGKPDSARQATGDSKSLSERISYAASDTGFDPANLASTAPIKRKEAALEQGTNMTAALDRLGRKVQGLISEKPAIIFGEGYIQFTFSASSVPEINNVTAAKFVEHCNRENNDPQDPNVLAVDDNMVWIHENKMANIFGPDWKNAHMQQVEAKAPAQAAPANTNAGTHAPAATATATAAPVTGNLTYHPRDVQAARDEKERRVPDRPAAPTPGGENLSVSLNPEAFGFELQGLEGINPYLGNAAQPERSSALSAATKANISTWVNTIATDISPSNITLKPAHISLTFANESDADLLFVLIATAPNQGVAPYKDKNEVLIPISVMNKYLADMDRTPVVTTSVNASANAAATAGAGKVAIRSGDEKSVPPAAAKEEKTTPLPANKFSNALAIIKGRLPEVPEESISLNKITEGLAITFAGSDAAANNIKCTKFLSKFNLTGKHNLYTISYFGSDRDTLKSTTVTIKNISQNQALFNDLGLQELFNNQDIVVAGTDSKELGPAAAGSNPMAMALIKPTTLAKVAAGQPTATATPASAAPAPGAPLPVKSSHDFSRAVITIYSLLPESQVKYSVNVNLSNEGVAINFVCTETDNGNPAKLQALHFLNEIGIYDNRDLYSESEQMYPNRLVSTVTLKNIPQNQRIFEFLGLEDIMKEAGKTAAARKNDTKEKPAAAPAACAAPTMASGGFVRLVNAKKQITSINNPKICKRILEGSGVRGSIKLSMEEQYVNDPNAVLIMQFGDEQDANTFLAFKKEQDENINLTKNPENPRQLIMPLEQAKLYFEGLERAVTEAMRAPSTSR